MITDTAGIYKKIISFALVEKKNSLACQLVRNKSYDSNFALSSLTPIFTVCSFHPTFSIFLHPEDQDQSPSAPCTPPPQFPRSHFNPCTHWDCNNSKHTHRPSQPLLYRLSVTDLGGQSCPISSLGSYRLTQFTSNQGCNMDTQADQLHGILKIVLLNGRKME